jgi:pilus assembly protein CpaE
MMFDRLRALVALDADVDRGVIEALLSVEPLQVVDYVDLARAEDENGGVGDVLIVACADFNPQVGEYLASVSRQYPARPVVLIAPADMNGYVTEAFDAGVDDIVALPAHSSPETARTFSQQTLFTVEKAVARRKGAGTAVALGRMICVLGLKGGSGKTLTAVNLAVALADAGHSVTIVDLDLQFGDVGLALGLKPTSTVYELIRSGGSLDADKLEDFLVTHPSGLRALLAPARPDQAGAVTPEALRDIYQVLRETHEFVVVDTPPSFTPQVIAAVDNSTDLCMVAMLDSLSLKNAKLGMETLQRMGYDLEKIRLVLNRADSKVGIGRDDVTAIMGARPEVLIPSDRSLTRSINEGQPIVLEHRRSDAAREFVALAGLYVGETKPAAVDGKHAVLDGKPAAAKPPAEPRKRQLPRLLPRLSRRAR